MASSGLTKTYGDCTYQTPPTQDVTAYVLVGLPGSGKSTWARNLIQLKPNTLIVGGDPLRYMISGGGYVYKEEFEPVVRSIKKAAIPIVLRSGFNLIIDETNITSKRRNELLVDIGDVARTVAVVFSEKNNNLQNRMKEARGYNAEKWQEVIEKMRAAWEDVNENFSDILYVSDPNDPKSFEGV